MTAAVGGAMTMVDGGAMTAASGAATTGARVRPNLAVEPAEFSAVPCLSSLQPPYQGYLNTDDMRAVGTHYAGSTRMY